MKSSLLTRVLIVFTIVCTCFSCRRFLNVKSDKSLSTPETLEDLQALFDGGEENTYSLTLMNIGSDEYYMDDAILQSFDLATRQAYVWDPETMQQKGSRDWEYLYRSIFYDNTVLDNLKKIPASGGKRKWNDIKGQALFRRARNFFYVAQEYAPPYDKITSDTDLGIPLRLSSDFNLPTRRATVAETYEQIIGDLTKVATLLSKDRYPGNQLNKTRPSRPAAYALLAKVYLTMGNYKMAKRYSDSCLLLYDNLIDFNNLDSTAAYPFSPFNSEVIFHAKVDAVNGYPWPYQHTDTNLIAMYAPNDLRKVMFYSYNSDSTYSFKGSYIGNFYLFAGLATDEVYLIRAESYARLGNVNAALKDLNSLLKKRWRKGTYVPYSTSDPQYALQLILLERRKELVNRGIRWMDLRRLNKDPEYAATLRRVYNNQIYTLPPNDPRYTWLIPDEVINLTGIQQNER